MEGESRVTERIVVFDLETQRSFNEVGGRAHIARLGVSLAVVYEYADRAFHVYHAHEVPQLVAALEQADVVVGFNVLRFDYLVLAGVVGRPVRPRHTIDMLADIHSRLGFRIELDSLASSTLGIRKSADGLQALRWWREGRIDLIRDYCMQDVDITRRLYEFGRDNGYVLYWDRFSRTKQRIPVNWRLPGRGFSRQKGTIV